jgi:RNA polymerase sigma factor (sigma-70 family)
MQQVLLDHAKARPRLNRGGGQRRQPATHFENVAGPSQHEPERIVKFDKLIRRLETESPDGAAVVRLRFFAGLSLERTAQTLGLSTSTVDRRWAFARAWLYKRLSEGS